jgi:hypothetical protein
MKTYRLDSTGRWTTLVLIIGALMVWFFALWKLPDMLSSEQVRVSYRDLPGTLGAAIEQGLTVSQIVPALLFIVLIVAVPLLIWNLVEEWFTTYIVREDGLEYDTVQGISVLYPWSAIRGVRAVDPEASEPTHEILVDPAPTTQIKNPVLRWLHRQAFGRSRIPVYPHVTDRDDLLQEVVSRAGLENIEHRAQNIEVENIERIREQR